MPAKVTNFISGACFGYFNENDKSCMKCKLRKGCSKASSSKEVNEVRKIFKITNKVVDELNKKYSK